MVFEDEPTTAETSDDNSNSNSNNNNEKKPRRRRLWRIVGSVLLIIVAVVVAVAVDLSNPGEPIVDLESVSVDLLRRTPVIEADLSFRFDGGEGKGIGRRRRRRGGGGGGPRLSRIEPVGLTADLPSGAFRFEIRRKHPAGGEEDEDGGGKHRYAATGTCRDSDAESHAGRLWDALAAAAAASERDLDVAGVLDDVLRDGTFALEATIWLGHVVPWRSTIDGIPLEMLLDMVSEKEEEEEEEGRSSNSDSNNNDNNRAASGGGGFGGIGICRMDALSMDVCIPLRRGLPGGGSGLPSSSSSSSSSASLRIKTPALRALAQPARTEGMVLALDAWEGSFGDAGGGVEGGNPSAVVSVSSADGHLPFYRPLLDLFLAEDEDDGDGDGGSDTTKIAVTVDGEESFLEILLGRHHEFYFENGSMDPEVFREEHSRRQRKRQRRLSRELSPVVMPSSSSSSSSSSSYPKNETGQLREGYAAAAARCIGAGEGDGDVFGFGMCWFLDMPRDRLTLIGNMTIFDRSLLAVSEISWTADREDYFEVEMTAEALMVGEEDDDDDDQEEGGFMNIFGLFALNATDETAVEVDLAFENTGSILPFVANLETTFRTGGDDDDPDLLFRIDVDDLTLFAGPSAVDDGEKERERKGIVGAAGGASASWTEEDFVVDLRLDHGESDFAAFRFDLDTVFFARGVIGFDVETSSAWDGRDLWDAGMNGVIDAPSVSFSTYNATVYDLPSGTNLSLGAHVHNDYDKSRLEARLSNDRGWDLALDVSSDTVAEPWGPGSGDSSVDTFDLALTEPSSELDLSVSAAAESLEGGRIRTLEAEIVRDGGSDEVTVDLRFEFHPGEEEGEDDEDEEKYGLFALAASSACVWDGKDRWKSDLSLTVDDVYDDADASTTVVVAAAIADSLHDFAMDAEINATAPADPDGSAAWIGSTNGVLDGEEIFDIEMSLIAEPSPSDDGGGVVTVAVDDFVSDFSMIGSVEGSLFGDEVVLKLTTFRIDLDGESYADASGEIRVDTDASRATLDLEDNAKMDFVAEAGASWYLAYDTVLLLDTLNVRRNEDVYLDGKANVTMGDLFSSMALDLDMPVATRELETDLVLDFTDSFLVRSRVHYWWEEEDFVDLTSRVAYFGYRPVEIWGGSGPDDHEGSWVELASVDRGDLGFAANLTAGIYDDHGSESYITSVERLAFSTKEDTYVDLTAKFREFWNDTLDGYQYELLSDTTEESDLQMDMEMGISSSDRYLETARMVVDRMVLGWRETSYIEMPLRLSTGGEAVAPEVLRLSGISTRLAGMPALTDSTRVAFEEATEEFYTDLYRRSGSRSSSSSSSSSEITMERRRLERAVPSFDFFATDVTVTGEDPDENGNTITYNQTVSYVTADATTTTASSTTMAEADVLDILSSPFEAESAIELYLDLLADRNSEFSRVSGVSPPAIAASGSEGSGSGGGPGAGTIAGIVAGCLFFVGGFCVCLGVYVVLRRRHYQTLYTEKNHPVDSSGAGFSVHEGSDDFFKTLEKTRGDHTDHRNGDDDDDSDVIDDDEITAEERSGDVDEEEVEEDCTEEESEYDRGGKESYQDEYDDDAEEDRNGEDYIEEDYIEEEIEEEIKDDTTGKEFYEDEYDTTGKEFYEDEYDDDDDDAEDDIEDNKPPNETTAAIANNTDDYDDDDDDDDDDKTGDGAGSNCDEEFRDEV